MKPTKTTITNEDDLPQMSSEYFGFFACMYKEKHSGKDEISISDATRFLALSPSRASRFVGDCIMHGYLEEKTDLKDRRKKRVRLAPQTEERITKAIDISMKSFAKIFEGKLAVSE